MAVYSNPNQVTKIGVSVFADGNTNGREQERVEVEQEVKSTVEIIPEFNGQVTVEPKSEPSLTETIVSTTSSEE